MNFMQKFVVALGITAVGLVMFFTLNTHHYSAPQQSIPTMTQTSTQPSIGNSNAKLRFVVFEDLKCANCKNYVVNLFPVIKQNYINTDKAQYTVVTLAFIPGSLPAANAAYCAYAQSTNHFFDFVEYLYKNQPNENEDWATIPRLMQMAQQVPGLDQARFGTCLVKSPYDNVMKQNLELARKTMGDNVATPALFINGIQVTPLTMEQIEKVASQTS